MTQKFYIGDIVNLKSGSPRMTIVSDKEGTNQNWSKIYNGQYLCSWFDGGSIQEALFPQEALEKEE